MILAGANRHAKEIIQILNENEVGEIVLFDDISNNLDSYFLKYKWLKSTSQIGNHNHKNFILALGGTISRYKVASKLINCGLCMETIISNSAIIGSDEVTLGPGLNIMYNVYISNCVEIGEGTLINSFASIHHDTKIGKYCDISPRATILGGCTVKDFTQIGAGSIILPDITVGENSIVGAGAVITKNIPSNCLVYGVPGRIINKLG